MQHARRHPGRKVIIFCLIACAVGAADAQSGPRDDRLMMQARVRLLMSMFVSAET